MGSPHPKQNPFAAAIPTRKPVNEPGPAETATCVTASCPRPVSPRRRSMAARNVSETCRSRGSILSPRTPPPETRTTLPPPRTRPPETRATLPHGVADSTARIKRLSGDQACDVVVEHERGEHEDQGQPHLLRHHPGLRGERFATQRLDREEDEMPPVEDRDGQEVQDAQVHAQQPEEVQKVGDSLPGLVPRHLGDEDGSSERIGGEDPHEELHHGEHGQVDDPPRLLRRAPDGGYGIDPPLDDLLAGHHPDLGPVDLLPENGAPLPDFRRDRHPDLLLPPANDQGKLLPGPRFPDPGGELLPSPHLSLPDADNRVARLQARPRRPRIPHHV